MLTIFQLVVFISLIVFGAHVGDAKKLVGSTSTSERHVNFIDDPSNFAIDFDSAQAGPDGTVCVERKKYLDKTEKDQLKECFVQNVTQCYYTYVTEYSEAEQEKKGSFAQIAPSHTFRKISPTPQKTLAFRR